MRKLLLLVIFSFLLGSTAYAGTPKWRLMVVFNEVDVGGHTRARDSYELVWTRSDGQQSQLIKKYKDEKKASNQGTKNKFFTQSISTSGSRYAVIFEYQYMKPMRKGAAKSIKGLKLKRGKYVGGIQRSFTQSKSAEKYTDIKVVEIVDMQSAVSYLNNVKNSANPYFGRIPRAVPGSACGADLWSESCKKSQKGPFRKAKAIGVRG